MRVESIEAKAETQGFERYVDIPSDLRDEVEFRLVKDGFNEGEARLALNNALVFLRAIVENPGVRLTPSETVDAAWHQLILFTQDYELYCSTALGRFVHHRPTRRDQAPDPRLLSGHDTYDFLRDFGYSPDEDAWAGKYAGCGRCDGGCDGGGGGGGDGCDSGCDGI